VTQEEKLEKAIETGENIQQSLLQMLAGIKRLERVLLTNTANIAAMNMRLTKLEGQQK
jgi:hypothetical protein